MSDKVRVGIVGLGRSGWNIHAKLLGGLSDRYQIVAVSDLDPGRREEAKERFGCNTYETIDGLLEDPAVELVIVASPSHLHAEHSIMALKAGKAVVCEKPMAATLEEADRMIETARETGNLLTVFQNRRYSQDFVKVKEIIDSGILGRIVLVRIAWHGFGRRWDWQTLKKFGGGSLRNTGPHLIDQALQLFGPAEPEIFCDMRRTLTLGDAEDHVKVVMKAIDAEAPLIDIEITSACAYPQDNWLVMGTQGGLTGTTRHLRWKYYKPEELPPRQLETAPMPDRSYNRDEITWYEEEWSLEEDQGPGQAGFYLDLYETLRHGAPLAITPESARRVMWVIEQCMKQCPV
ncbi:MAG TPA: Gfo/Idh/MocA family oxidoreductase [Caldilineae bacterium]|nr:Gfo/Idh/MocA family oxidoreductase [Caldilineae bacterium]